MVSATISHYRILDKLGEGGMGVVYLAEDTSLKRKVALKVLPPEVAGDPDRLKRFRREAEALATLNHPNIVTVYSVDEDAGTHFLTMELVEGQTLDRIVPAGGLSLERFFDLAVPLADALAAAHQRGVVHRDLKPPNILVADDGRLKILDFGLAKLQEPSQGEAHQGASQVTDRLTETGMVMGTVAYLAPEQLQGQPADHRSDLFALGIVLFEMATGRHPFSGGTSMEVLSSILRDDPLALDQVRPELPRHLKRLVRRCLHKDPRRRIQSVLDLRNELAELRDELATPGRDGVAGIPTELDLPAAAADSRQSGHDIATAGAGTPEAGTELAGSPPETPEAPRSGSTAPRLSTRVAALAGVAGLVALLGLAGYAYLGRGAEQRPAAAEGRRVIAVLPFSNLAGGEENEYFADGITEDILMNLGLVPDFAVISRTSAMRYKGSEKSIPEIARELGAEYVLEGSVRRAGDQVRINVQLVEPATDTTVWNGTLDRRLEDIFALQSEIAYAVVDALEGELAGGVGERMGRAPTRDLAAYDLFLRARAAAQEMTPEAQSEAIELLSQAIERDPQFALAHAVRSSLSALLHFSHGADRSHAERGLDWARRAIALEPDLGEGHRALGTAMLALGHFGEASRAFEQALDLNPSDYGTMNNLSLAYAMTGDWDRGLELLRASLLYDPVNEFVIRTNVANQLRILGFYERAAVEARRAHEERPDYWVASYSLVWVDVLQGRTSEAVQRLLELAPEDGHPRALASASWLLLLAGAEAEARPRLERVHAAMPNVPGLFAPAPAVHLAYLLHRAGEARRAEGILAAFEGVARERMAGGDTNPTYPYSLAGAYAVRGDREAALDWLERAVESGWNQPEPTRRDPLLADLREEPRFRSAVAHMDDRIEAMRRRVEREGW